MPRDTHKKAADHREHRATHEDLNEAYQCFTVKAISCDGVPIGLSASCALVSDTGNKLWSCLECQSGESDMDPTKNQLFNRPIKIRTDTAT